ncbi:MAG: hypothetical protein M3313_01355 [Actinomycetota bacterium]|nr:hypothetical protein [Actinomycetota bacterium]
MPRRSRPRKEPAPAQGDPAPALLRDQQESGPDGDWVVRPVTGAANNKTYRCPGCDHEIRPATPHLVVWAAEDSAALDRRHWHRTCWHARRHRNPGRSRW